MPNWTSTTINVKLPTENVEKFLSYFIKCDDVGKKQGRHFYRTFIDDSYRSDLVDGNTILKVTCECAWSVDSCMMRDNGFTECLTLKDAISECGIKKMNIVSDEPGIQFLEYIEYGGGSPDDIDYKEIDYGVS